MRKLAIAISTVMLTGALAAQHQPAQEVMKQSRQASQQVGAKPQADAPAASPRQASLPAKTAKPKPSRKPGATAAKAAAAPEMRKPAADTARTRGRRDPFVSPLRLVEEQSQNSANCSGGARCLVVDQITLKGIVRTQNGMIAMVENSARKQYNLRENDTVFNGSVVKITIDSVVFRQNTTDALGKPVSKEVVKRVTVPAV